MKSTKAKIIKNCILFIAFMAIVSFYNWYVVLAEETTATEVVETTTIAIEQTTIEETTTAIVNNGKYSISQKKLTLEKGKKKQLKVYNLPKANAKVKWTSSNKFAVKVSAAGKVTAKNYGVATIKATCRKKVVSCVVTVPDSSRRVTLDKKKITLIEGETYQLTAISQNEVSYISRNESIATVDENGLVRAINPGKTTIVAKSSTGFANIVITVKSGDTELTSSGKMSNPKYTRIRRYTNKGKVVYSPITWRKNKEIRFVIDGIDQSQVKKCTWITEDEIILTKPKAESNKIVAIARTQNLTGRVKVTAKVKFKDKTVKEYNSYVYVTDPQINSKDIILLGKKAGDNRQQYITINGLSKYSTIKYTMSDESHLKITPYKTKLSITGVKKGNGIIKITVDGKTFKVNYNVCPVKFGTIDSFLPVNNTTQISIKGISGITPEYSVRNPIVASVATDGTIKGLQGGVTYVDVKIGYMNYSYRVEVAAKGMKKIINRGKYILKNWKYSQGRRYEKGFYDCSALVWKSYKKYKDYHLLIGGEDYAYSAGDLFDYLEGKKQIIYYGYLNMDDLQPGDLIFYGDYENAVKYSTPGRTLDIYHVSMYIGNGEILEKGGDRIDGNSCKYIVGIGRVVK